MQRTARRFGFLTLVLLTFALPGAQADEVATQKPLDQSDAFLQSAAASRRASAVLSTVFEASTPVGLSTSAALIPSESVRVQFWQQATPAPAAAVRTVVVREGQSLWEIASAWGVSVQTIAAANGLANPEYLKPGQQLRIPPATDPGAPVTPAVQAGAPRARARTTGARPLAVTLGEGQTLWSLARAHGVSVEAIAEANGLRDADRVRAGRRLVIPGRTAASRPSRLTTARVTPRRAGEALTKAASATAVRIAQGFLWPARGRLTSRFGWRRWRHHDGIDIAAPYGSPIYAARPGRVVFAGWYFAYGRAVIVDHGDGAQTLYGHASKLHVRTGQTVGQGELIATVGSSGRATGPHVHFEVRVNGRPVNPMKYME